MPTPLSARPIRLLTRDDLAACANLSESRGWARGERRWKLLLTASTAYGMDAPDGKGLASTCVVTPYGPNLAAIGMVLVAERYARQGIGHRLMTHVLQETGRTPLTLYATPSGRPLYDRLGFTEVGQAEALLGRFSTPGRPAPLSVRPAKAADLPALVRLDAAVFGADRTHLLTRLPSFADRLLVAEDGSTLTGFAAAWATDSTDVAGPLVARDTETAKALVTSLAAGSDLPLRIVIDTRHDELLAWLKARGLAPVAVSASMTYRVPDLPGDWTRRYAPLNQATS